MTEIHYRPVLKGAGEYRRAGCRAPQERAHILVPKGTADGAFLAATTGVGLSQPAEQGQAAVPASAREARAIWRGRRTCDPASEGRHAGASSSEDCKADGARVVAPGSIGPRFVGRVLQMSHAHRINIASMSHRDNFDFEAGALARLAALQRLLEQAKAGHREAMVHSLEKLIEQEARSLRSAKDTDAEPA